MQRVRQGSTMARNLESTRHVSTPAVLKHGRDSDKTYLIWLCSVDKTIFKKLAQMYVQIQLTLSDIQNRGAAL